MGLRNKRPDLNGVLIIDKPLGWSSADVCRLIRRRTRGAKVGHAGTLDPLATGVLVVCLGRATKLVPRLMDTTKAYRADLDLSAFSNTDDEEGTRTPIDVPSPPTLQTIRNTLTQHFTGEIDQRPPAFSAVKIRGKPSYKLARAGESSELEPKRIQIHRIDVLEYHWPRLVLDVECSKGTYIRSIARDLGTALKTGGMLTALVRTRVGDLTLSQAIAPEDLPDPLEPDHLKQL